MTSQTRKSKMALATKVTAIAIPSSPNCCFDNIWVVKKTWASIAKASTKLAKVSVPAAHAEGNVVCVRANQEITDRRRIMKAKFLVCGQYGSGPVGLSRSR